MKFTERNIGRLQLKTGQVDGMFWDDDIAGFGIRIREGGSRKFVFRYRRGARQRSVVIGNVGSMAVADARSTASKLEAQVRLGGDPALAKEVADRAADETFERVAGQFIEARRSSWRSKTLREIERHLLVYSKPLHRLPLTAVTQRAIAGLLADLARTSGDTTANRVRTSLTALLGWALREGVELPKGNVAMHTNKRSESARNRVLSGAELAIVWNACQDDAFGAAMKLLILTGQRENEIGGLRWDEVHDEQFILPEERTKNARVHVVPLCEPAKAILTRFERDDRACVFGRRVDNGFSGWGYGKAHLDARITAAGAALATWRIHDIRRSVATGMAELGVQPHIIEAVLNHVSGHKAGVAGIYNRATYDKEKREALNLWAEQVTALVEGRKAVVVPMKKGA